MDVIYGRLPRCLFVCSGAPQRHPPSPFHLSTHPTGPLGSRVLDHTVRCCWLSMHGGVRRGGGGGRQRRPCRHRAPRPAPRAPGHAMPCGAVGCERSWENIEGLTAGIFSYVNKESTVSEGIGLQNKLDHDFLMRIIWHGSPP